jgi:Tfp pilus assembly protein PilF
LDPSYREAYMALATALYQHGEKEKACEVYKTSGDKGSLMAEELISKFCE